MPKGRPNHNPRPADDDSLFQGKNWLSYKIMLAIAHWTPRCNEMTHLISHEMDHSLPWPIRFKMQVHYLVCCYCKRYKNNLYYIRSLVKRLHEHMDNISALTLPPDEKDRLKQVLRNEMGSS
jgi:hypothetical protein